MTRLMIVVDFVVIIIKVIFTIISLTVLTDCAAKDASQTELTVLIDRAQGGASLASGELEVMLHRRTLFDDQRGVGEPLNETMQGCMHCPSAGLIARGRHWLTLQVCPTYQG